MTFTITTTPSTGGTITPSNPAVVAGEDQAFVIAPSSGYYLTAVTVDGISVGVIRSCAFPAVSATHTVTATFAAQTLVHLPERKTEQAFVKLAEVYAAGISGLTIATRFSNTVLVEPAVLISCERCEPYIKGTGNWNVEVKFAIQSHYAKGTDSTAHDNYVAAVSDMLMMDGIVAALNAVGIAAFTALHWTPGVRTNTVEEHSIITELEGILKMMPS